MHLGWKKCLCSTPIKNKKLLLNVHKIKGVNLQCVKASKGAKMRNRYNQVPHLTQETNGKVTNSQLDTTNERQEVIPFGILKFEYKSDG